MSQTNTLLGYPDDARLLIINADDFGLCHAITDGIFRALQAGVVTSTTLMVPCPWAGHAMHLLRENPDITFGVHLTVICEAPYYRWGPVIPKDKVPSLVDETGNFYRFERMAEFLAQVNLHELELEFRAQIETVLTAELKPTHVDWHCLRQGGGPEVFALMLRLAQEYGLAMRVAERPWIESVQSQGLACNDYDFLDSYGLPTVDKSARYAQLLRDLPVGLSEWAVHPGLDNAESRAIQTLGTDVRQADFDFLMSPEARQIIQQEGIVLLSYQPLQEIWQNR